MTSAVQLLLLSTIALNAALASDFPFSAILAYDSTTQNPLYTVEWSFNPVKKTITFRLTANTTGWMGFGLSLTGGMKDADIVVGWVRNGEAELYDCYADGEQTPTVDARQDWEVETGYEAGGSTTFVVSRKWVTCDDRDVELTDGTIKLIYSYNDEDPTNVTSLRYHGTKRGSLAKNLFGDLINPPSLSADMNSFSISMINVTVPHDKSTTYWCLSSLLPDYIQRTKVYVKKFAILLTQRNAQYAHHAELYLCKLTNRTKQLGFNNECNHNAGACSSRTLIAAWAIGGSDYIYPEGIAYPIGGDTDEFVWLEVHYDNPELHSGILDSTGFKFYYTETPPIHEAGVLAVGHMITPLMVIPPNTKSYTIYGLCGSSCMKKFIPDEGIHVISNGFHTHLAGTGLQLDHLRPNPSCNGGYEELAPISKNLRYNFDFQQVLYLSKEITVLPDDLLVLRCIYNTLDRTKVTLGGDSTHDEMCFAFLTYYPQINLTTCASLTYMEPSFVENDLSNEGVQLLSNISLLEGDNARKEVLNVFENFHWNKQKISDFQSAIQNGYQLAFCESTSDDIAVTFESQLPKPGCIYKDTNASCAEIKTVSTAVHLCCIKIFMLLLLPMHYLLIC